VWFERKIRDYLREQNHASWTTSESERQTEESEPEQEEQGTFNTCTADQYNYMHEFLGTFIEAEPDEYVMRRSILAFLGLKEYIPSSLGLLHYLKAQLFLNPTFQALPHLHRFVIPRILSRA
jgi:hypothetical protein